MKGGDFVNVDKLVHFAIEKIHSNKKNTDYYAVCISLGDVSQVICWLTEAQFEQIKSKLS